jgi:hypothetical protein
MRLSNWPGEGFYGQNNVSLISFLGPSNTREPAAEIVCVVADAREVNLKGPLIPVAYVPLDQVDDRYARCRRTGDLRGAENMDSRGNCAATTLFAAPSGFRGSFHANDR